MSNRRPRGRPPFRQGATMTAATARHRRIRVVLRWTARLAVVLLLALAGLVFAATRAPVTLPGWVSDRVAAGLDLALHDTGLQVHLDSIGFDFREHLAPAFVVEGLAVGDGHGTPLLNLDQLTAIISLPDLLAGRIAPTAILARGAQLSLGRDQDGRLTLRLGGQTVMSGVPSPGALLDSIRTVLGTPHLTGLRVIGIEDLSMRFDDLSRGHAFASEGGHLRLDHDAGGALTLDAEMGQLTGVAAVGTAPGHVGLRIDSPARGAATGRLTLRGVVPSEIAGIAGPSPLADLLARIAAPVSLTLTGSLIGDGSFGALDGQMAVGDGTLDLPGRSKPFAVTLARGQMALDAEKDNLSLTGLVLESPDISLRGRLDLSADQIRPRGIVVQAAIEQLRVAVPRFYDQPLEIEGIWADMRYDRISEELDIAGLSLKQGDTLFSGRGHIAAGTTERGESLSGGTRVIALDLETERTSPETLVALWPRGMANGARDWIAERVKGGEFRNVSASVRLAAGIEPAFGLSFEIADARVHPVPVLPEITEGQGMGQIAGRTLSIAVASARMAAPDGSPIALSNGAIQIADIAAAGEPLSVRFDAGAGADAAIALLSNPPFADRRPDGSSEFPLAPGEAAGQLGLSVSLTIPLKKSTRFADVAYGVTGAITGFRSAHLLPGKTILSDRLSVSADPERIVIAGPGTVDGQPVTATYTRPQARGGPPKAALVHAEGPLTDALAKAFGVALPARTLAGAGHVVADVTLPPGGEPLLKLKGELSGLSVSVPALGIAKGRDRAGTLEVAGRLGPKGRLDPIRVTFPGLSLVAATDLPEGGKGQKVEVREIKVGRWLDAKGSFWPTVPARVALSGGTVDIRHLPESGGGGGGDPALSEIDVALDRVVVTDRIALTGVRGKLSGNLSGRLTGQVNRATAVGVALDPKRAGMAIQVTSADAGGVLRAAQVFDTLQGGALDLRLLPAGRGTYNGHAEITNTSLRKAPVMADLLSALSVVGALEQLAGEGIRFSDIRADFLLRPDRIDVSQASAVGASIGLSAAGSFDLARNTMDIQGVVSPVYFLNRAGGPRRGEGLIGITYHLTGPTAKPKVSVNPLSVLAPGFLRDLFRGRNQPQAVTRGEGN